MQYVGLDNLADFGIGTSATVAFGHIIGGEAPWPDGDFDHVPGAGGQDEVVWGMNEPKCTIETLYKGEAVMANVARTVFNGLPPLVTIKAGVIGLTNGMNTMSGYMNRARLRCGGVGEAVQAIYEVFGLSNTRSTATAGQMATPTATASYVWYRGAATIGGSAYGAQSWETEHEEGLKWGTSLDASASPLRDPEEIVPGNEVNRVRVTVKAPPNIDFGIDTPTLPITCSFVIGNGFTLHTNIVTGIYLKPYATRIAAGDDFVLWDLEGETKFNPIRSTAATAWGFA